MADSAQQPLLLEKEESRGKDFDVEVGEPEEPLPLPRPRRRSSRNEVGRSLATSIALIFFM
jgi:hypothetical protein